jgi:hypothetical protein
LSVPSDRHLLFMLDAEELLVSFILLSVQ